MKYQILKRRTFKTAFKKLSAENQRLVMDVIRRLAAGEQLEPKYCDHALSGPLAGLRDCHVRPNLVLLYEKDEGILTLTCINIQNHANVFKR